MPAELRHILFRPAEVVQAVKEYHRRLGKPLPTGAVVGCAPESDEAGGVVRFRIELVPDVVEGAPRPSPGTEQRCEIVLEGPALAAALILHCRDRRIPLPANAGKSLELFGSQLCLVATINPKQEELPRRGQLRL
ncbi:MAG: hypothetical protein JO326_13875 [Acetobacteraceae bacterium]|nr:hypothetical protein [Acetobacteraceae bacterium]